MPPLADIVRLAWETHAEVEQALRHPADVVRLRQLLRRAEQLRILLRLARALYGRGSAVDTSLGFSCRERTV